MSYLEEVKASITNQQTDLSDKSRSRSALEKKLLAVLDMIPADIKSKGISLNVIQQQLKGRTRGYAHPGEIGIALRSLGYIRKRTWQDQNTGYVAKWYQSAPESV